MSVSFCLLFMFCLMKNCLAYTRHFTTLRFDSKVWQRRRFGFVFTHKKKVDSDLFKLILILDDSSTNSNVMYMEPGRLSGVLCTQFCAAQAVAVGWMSIPTHAPCPQDVNSCSVIKEREENGYQLIFTCWRYSDRSHPIPTSFHLLSPGFDKITKVPGLRLWQCSRTRGIISLPLSRPPLHPKCVHQSNQPRLYIRHKKAAESWSQGHGVPALSHSPHQQRHPPTVVPL